MTCQDCGLEDESVFLTNCPFADELYNEIVEVQLCDKCFNERLRDV